MSSFFNFIIDFVLMIFVLYFQIHPFYRFSIVIELKGLYLWEEIGPRSSFFDLLVKYFLECPGPGVVVLEPSDVVVQFFFPWQVFLCELFSE